MARAISLTPFQYVLKRDREGRPEDRTVFLLRRLSAREREQIGNIGFSVDRETDKMNIAVNEGAVVNSHLRIGLLGWENFRDQSGGPLVFAPPELGMCAWSNIDALEHADRSELAHAIEKGNTLGETEIKN